jgi:hypothetical protein
MITRSPSFVPGAGMPYAADMFRLSALAFLALMLPAHADEPGAPKMPPPAPEPHISSFGDRDKTCMEWTDACVVCTRPANGAAQCSTPGIACTPGPTVCRIRK